jgi:hypothetical protein
LNSRTSRVHYPILGDKIARVISAWHVENRLGSRRWFGTSRSQLGDNLTGSPWVVSTGHEDEASRLGKSKPATSVLIGGVISSGGIKTECVPILGWEPLAALSDPVGILNRARDDRLLSVRCSVLPPKTRTQLVLGY